MTEIVDVRVRKILDSRGNETVEAVVITKSGVGIGGGHAAAPAGASTGEHEVVSYPGGSVDKAIEVFNTEVAPKLRGLDAKNQVEIDTMLHEIDGTDNFSHIGGNIATAVSLGAAWAAANSMNIPLYMYLGGNIHRHMPIPFGNVIGGGVHAIGGTDIQEYLSVATGGSMADRVFANAKVHKKVKEILIKKLPNSAIGKGDEGAWVAHMGDREALEVMVEATEAISEETGISIRPGVDVAASELYDDKKGKYVYKDRTLDPGEQIDFIVDLIGTYNLVSVEDPLDEDDFEGFKELTSKVGDRCLIIGDDLFVTSLSRIKKGIGMGAANAVLIKPNQVGTLSDTFDAIQYSHKHGYKTVISHRSGETTDVTIAHLSVAFGAYGIKTGTVGGERISKLNELIRIEEDLGLNNRP